MLCSSVVRLKRKGNYFKWIKIIISSLVVSLTFQLKANDCVWSCICLRMLLRDASVKQRIPCIIRISIFRVFSAEKKCALYMGKYGNYGKPVARHCKCQTDRAQIFYCLCEMKQ